MIVEGKGHVVPAPVRITLSRGDVELIRREAARRDKFRGYSARRDKWGRGLVAGSPAFYGMCGEWSLCRYLNRRLGLGLVLDTVLRKGGDGGVDVVASGLRVQVKTLVTGVDLLIRRIDERKRVLGLASEAYVFAAMSHRAPDLHEPPTLPCLVDAPSTPTGVKVDLLGWIARSDARRVGTSEHSRKGDWWNLRIDRAHLQAMTRLCDEARLRSAS